VTSTARSLSPDFSPRLFDPGPHHQETPPPMPWNPRWSLKRYYEECYLPRALAEDGRHPETIRKDRQALEEFSWVCGAVPLGDFGAEHWLAFVRGLRAICSARCGGGPRAQNTLRGLAIHARHILAEASMEEWRDAEGQRHVGLVQLGRLKVPALEHREPDDCFNVEEMGRAIACCRAEPFSCAYLPAGLSPTRFWPALLMFEWNTGLRPKSIFAARREWIGKTLAGWLHVPKEALKHQRRSWEFYLNKAARQAVDLAASDDPHVFPWRGWPNTKPQLYAEHKKIFLAAGLPEERAAFQFKGSRRAVVKWVMEHLGPEPDLDVVRLILGHQFQGSLGYYARRGAIVPPLLDRLPQPMPHLPLCG